MLWGGDYAASLSAFTFLSIGAAVLVSLVLANTLLGDKRLGLCATLFVLVAVLLIDGAVPEYDNAFSLLKSVIVPGNSARMIRGVAPVLFVSVLLLGKFLIQKFKLFSRMKASRKSCFWRLFVVYVAVVFLRIPTITVLAAGFALV